MIGYVGLAIALAGAAAALLTETWDRERGGLATVTVAGWISAALVGVGLVTAMVAQIAAGSRLATAEQERAAAVAETAAARERLAALDIRMRALAASEQELRTRREALETQLAMARGDARGEAEDSAEIEASWRSSSERKDEPVSRFASRPQPKLQLVLTKSVDLESQAAWTAPMAFAADGRIELADFDCAMLLEFLGRKLFLRVRPESASSVALDRASDVPEPVALTRLGGAKCVGRLMVYAPVGSGVQVARGGEPNGERVAALATPPRAPAVPPATPPAAAVPAAQPPAAARVVAVAPAHREPASGSVSELQTAGAGSVPLPQPAPRPTPAPEADEAGPLRRLESGFPAPFRKPTPPRIPIATGGAR
jgi:hypothetical protein